MNETRKAGNEELNRYSGGISEEKLEERLKAASSPRRMFIIMAAAILASEALVMLIAHTLPDIGHMWVILDPFLLIAMLCPLLYFFLFRPITDNIMKRRHAEEDLREEEEKLHSIAAATSDAIIMNDEEGRVVFWNKAAEKMFGYSAKEVIGRDLREIIISPAHLAPFERDLKTFRETGEWPSGDKAFEAATLSKGGHEFPVEISIASVKLRDGRRAIAVIRDITARKLSEKAVMESSERYRNIVEHSHDLIWMRDAEGRIVFANRRVEEVTGYRPGDYAGKGFAPYALKEDLPGAIEAFKKTLEGKPQQYEVRLIRKDGTALTLSVKTASVYSNGKIAGTVNFGRDITDERRAEEELRGAEVRYRTIFEQSPAGIVIIDPETALPVEFNDTACGQLGYSRDEFAKLRVNDYEAQERPEETMERIGNIVRTGRDSFETRHASKSGDIRNVLVTVQKVNLSGRNFLYCVFRDITEIRRAEEEIRQRVDELERFQKIAVKREFKIKELREKIKTLEDEIKSFKLV